MGIKLGLLYCIIALVSDYRSEISVQYILLFWCLLYNTLAYSEKELARIGPVGQAGVILGLLR